MGKEWKHLLSEVDKGEIAIVKKAIIDKYGFEVSEQYCRDFIAFVNRVYREEPSEQRE